MSDELQDRLLALAAGTVHLDIPRYTEQLLERGRVFKKYQARLRPGVPHRCHQNAALGYLAGLVRGGPPEIVAGYGYCGGLWVPHSWLWDGRHVLETTVKLDLYYG